MPFHNYASAVILLCKFVLRYDLEIIMSMYDIRACASPCDTVITLCVVAVSLYCIRCSGKH